MSGVCTIQNVQTPPVQLCIVHFAFSDTRQSILHIIIKDTKRFENKFWKTRTFGLGVYHSIAEQSCLSYIFIYFYFLLYRLPLSIQYWICYRYFKYISVYPFIAYLSILIYMHPIFLSKTYYTYVILH